MNSSSPPNAVLDRPLDDQQVIEILGGELSGNGTTTTIPRRPALLRPDPTPAPAPTPPPLRHTVTPPLPKPPRHHGATAHAWLVRHRQSLLILTGLLVVVGIVHGIGMNQSPGPVDDEGTYMAQSWAVQVRHALTPYTYWYDHPPLGWIQLSGWTFLTDGFRGSVLAIQSGRALMLVLSLANAALLYLIARRLKLSRLWASVIVLAFGLSPLAVSYTRTVYLDNIAMPWLLAAFALALTPRRRLWAYAASGVCFAVAVLSKETMLIFGPALLYLVWQRADRATRAFCLAAWLSLVALLVAVYPLLAALRGELLSGHGHVSLASAIAFQLSGRQSSGSPLSATSPAHSLVAGWLHLDPWLLILGALALPIALAVRRYRPFAVAQLIALVMVLRGGYLPVPFVISLLPFSALLIGMAGSVIQNRLWRGRLSAMRIPGAVRAGALLGLGGALVLSATPAWASGLDHLMTSSELTPTAQAERYIETHVSHRDHLLIDDTMWVDLVDHGFNRPYGVVWFYKLGYVNNLDPSVARALPAGWRDFEYVVDTPSMRAALSTPGQLPEIEAAVTHSRPVATFGTGPDQIVLRRISGPTSSAADPPPSAKPPPSPRSTHHGRH